MTIVFAFICFACNLCQKTHKMRAGGAARGGRIDPADEGISMLETCMPRKPREDRPLIGRPEPPPSRRGRKGRGRGLAARDSYGRDADDDDDELL